GPLAPKEEHTRMFRINRWILSALALAGLVAVAGVAVAALVSEVKDDGGFFTAEAIKKANREIKAIKEQLKHDLVIETFKEVQADKKADFEKIAKDTKEKARFFDEWAHQRFRELDVNGIYIMICKNPTFLEVRVGNDARKKAFTEDNL